MFDCAYEPERVPEPTATAQKARIWPVVAIATLLVLATLAAACLGNVAASFVLS